jgi:hypothetical protein
MLIEAEEYPEHVTYFALKHEAAIRDLLQKYPDSAGMIAIDGELHASFNLEHLAEEFEIPDEVFEVYRKTPSHILPFVVVFVYTVSAAFQFAVLGYPRTPINAKGGSA